MVQPIGSAEGVKGFGSVESIVIFLKSQYDPQAPSLSLVQTFQYHVPSDIDVLGVYEDVVEIICPLS